MGFSEKDKIFIFQVFLTVFVLLFGTVMYFSIYFVRNCIFHWPIRWDIGTCWNEQIQPAQDSAVKDASVVAP